MADRWSRYPGAEKNLLYELSEAVRCQNEGPPRLPKRQAEGSAKNTSSTPLSRSTTCPALRKYPFIFMTAEKSFPTSDKERENLTEYLTSGGFLMADDCVWSHDGDYFFQYMCQLLDELFGAGSVRRIPEDHEVMHNVYDMRGHRAAALLGRQSRPDGTLHRRSPRSISLLDGSALRLAESEGAQSSEHEAWLRRVRGHGRQRMRVRHEPLKGGRCMTLGAVHVRLAGLTVSLLCLLLSDIAAGLDGRAVYADGKPAPGVVVYAIPDSQVFRVNGNRVMAAEGLPRAISAPDGRFTIPDAEPGAFALFARDMEDQCVYVPATQVASVLTKITVTAPSRLEVEIYRGKEPVSGEVVHAGLLAGACNFAYGLSATTNAAGNGDAPRASARPIPHPDCRRGPPGRLLFPQCRDETREGDARARRIGEGQAWRHGSPLPHGEGHGHGRQAATRRMGAARRQRASRVLRDLMRGRFRAGNGVVRRDNA